MCGFCVDNTCREGIFREKFEDPNYYLARGVKQCLRAFGTELEVAFRMDIDETIRKLQFDVDRLRCTISHLEKLLSPVSAVPPNGKNRPGRRGIPAKERSRYPSV
jgi:hypothetical protein